MFCRDVEVWLVGESSDVGMGLFLGKLLKLAQYVSVFVSEQPLADMSGGDKARKIAEVLILQIDTDLCQRTLC